MKIKGIILKYLYTKTKVIILPVRKMKLFKVLIGENWILIHNMEKFYLLISLVVMKVSISILISHKF